MRLHGLLCLEIEGDDDPRSLLERLSPRAARLSVDRRECGSHEPSAILVVGRPELAGDESRVDVGVVLGSGGTLELQRREGTWRVVRVIRPWIALHDPAQR